MDYQAFFNDVSLWIEMCNEKAKNNGMNSPIFWDWVADTLAGLCEKYNNHELAQTQTIMLWDWLQGKIKKVG